MVSISFLNNVRKAISNGVSPPRWSPIGSADNQRSLRMGKTLKKTLYPAKVEQKERELLFERFGIVKKYCSKVSKDVIGNWHDIVSEDEKLVSILDDATERLQLVNTFSTAHEFAMRDGYALIFLDWNDDADISKPVDWDRAGLDEAVVIVAPECTINQAKDGRIGSYSIKSFKRPSDGKPYEIHPDRVIRHVHEEHPLYPTGVSVIDCNYNTLLSLQNAVWGVGQTIFRYGSAIPILYHKGLSDKERDDLDDMFAEMHAWTSMAMDEDVGHVDFAGAQGRALNPEPYLTILMDQLCAGWNIPKTVLLGSQAGAVTGSEFNWKDYYSDINSTQTTVVESRIHDLYYRILRANGYSEEKPAFEISWRPQAEMDELVKSELGKNKAETINKMLAAGVDMNTARQSVGLDPVKRNFMFIPTMREMVYVDDAGNVANAVTNKAPDIADVFRPPNALLDITTDEMVRESIDTARKVIEDWEVDNL